MTLVQAFAKLFPCTYRARNGKEVVITGFCFKGYFKKIPERDCVWDDKMNFLKVSSVNSNETRQFDLVELIESPLDEKKRKKKVVSL